MAFRNLQGDSFIKQYRPSQEDAQRDVSDIFRRYAQGDENAAFKECAEAVLSNAMVRSANQTNETGMMSKL